MTNFITKQGFVKLQARLEYLKKVKRYAVAEAIEEAREVSGELNDNPELEIARREQNEVEQEIAELESSLDNAQVITKHPGSLRAVRVGSVVKVRSQNGEWQFTIVGSREADPKFGKISHISPIGQALLNRQTGEKVKVKLPDGQAEYEICAIQ